MGGQPGAVTPVWVRRHRLAATGSGKGPRYPKADRSGVAGVTRPGRGTTATNFYARDKQVARWLVKDRARANKPLAQLGAVTPIRLWSHATPGSAVHRMSMGPLRPLPQLSNGELRVSTAGTPAQPYRMGTGSGPTSWPLCPAAFALDARPHHATLGAEFPKRADGRQNPAARIVADTLRSYWRTARRSTRLAGERGERERTGSHRLEAKACLRHRRPDGPCKRFPRTCAQLIGSRQERGGP